MGSKEAILVLGLLAMVFLISSEVAARDLAEASSKKGELAFCIIILMSILNQEIMVQDAWPSC